MLLYKNKNFYHKKKTGSNKLTFFAPQKIIAKTSFSLDYIILYSPSATWIDTLQQNINVGIILKYKNREMIFFGAELLHYSRVTGLLLCIYVDWFPWGRHCSGASRRRIYSSCLCHSSPRASSVRIVGNKVIYIFRCDCICGCDG